MLHVFKRSVLMILKGILCVYESTLYVTVIFDTALVRCSIHPVPRTHIFTFVISIIPFSSARQSREDKDL